MNNKTLSTLFILFCALAILVLFVKNLREKKKYQIDYVTVSQNKKSISDSLLKNKFEIYYLKKNLGIAYNNKAISDTVSAYTLLDGKQDKKYNLNTLLNTPKEKLVIRYTEIGCNACSDSTFRFIKHSPAILKKYKIFTLVDFSDYMAYLKWRKFSDVQGTILWVKKGSLPFASEGRDDTYLFITGRAKVPNSFFIPNSMLAQYIRQYLHSISE